MHTQDWDAGWSSATATHTKTSSSAAPTATSLSHNVTTLTYPRCSPDSSRAWCGIVVGGTNSTYNVSITDSACKQLTTKSNIKEDATPISFSTDVGSWTFGVRGDNGLNMTYNGRNVSDFQAWDSWAIETLDYESDTLVMYGGITNCTAADKEKKDDNDDESGAMKVGVSGMGMAVALAAVAVGMAGLF